MKQTDPGETKRFFEPVDWKKAVTRIVVICCAAVLMSLNIKTFVRTGGLFPGGATGLSILIQRAAQTFFHIEIPYAAINILINAVPIWIGFRFIGKKFTLYSCLMIVLTSVLTDLIPAHVITQDTLLIAIFGGMINGTAISMCLLVDATTGGTDFLSIFLSERKNIDAFNIIFGFNVLILCAAGLMFGWDKALYSIIFQFASTQVLHFLYRRYQQGTLWIVTNSPHEVSEAIHRICHHGATILEGEGAYEHCERYVVYSVVSRAEVRKVMRVVKAVDPKAFVNVMRTEQLYGRFYRRPED